MAAHEKFVRLDKLSHVFLTVYSVALLGFSVFQPHLASSRIGPYSSEIVIVLSLSILCASLVIWGLNFGGKARDHRDCYLALQRLHESIADVSEIKAEYQAILDAHPNHSHLDYERFLFRKIIINGSEVRNSAGPISIGFWRGFCYILTEIFCFLALSVLVLSPIIIIYVIYVFA